MADEYIDPNLSAIVSAQEIDDVVSQFRLFNRRLSQQSVIPVLPPNRTVLTSIRQRQKLFSELPKMTEADLVASGHQGELVLVQVSCFTHAHGCAIHR